MRQQKPVTILRPSFQEEEDNRIDWERKNLRKRRSDLDNPDELDEVLETDDELSLLTEKQRRKKKVKRNKRRQLVMDEESGRVIVKRRRKQNRHHYDEWSEDEYE